MLRACVVMTLLALGFASRAEAGGCCCPSCGCRQVKKICLCVPDVKNETKFEFSAVCEDFCVPGPSRVVGHCQTKDCQGCDVCQPVRQPSCAQVRTRVKLVKTPVTCETPTLKWIVKTVCCRCGTCCGDHGDSCVEPGGRPCAAAVSTAGAMPAANADQRPAPRPAPQPVTETSILPVESAGVPPLPPEVPPAVPPSYRAGSINTGSSTLLELLSAEQK
jgi:hypothetical protein